MIDLDLSLIASCAAFCTNCFAKGEIASVDWELAGLEWNFDEPVCGSCAFYLVKKSLDEACCDE